VSVPGAVTATGAVRCRVERCTLRHLGGYGVELGRGCRDSEVAGCALYDLGGGGVKLGTQLVADAPLTGFNRVTDCEITRGGLIFHSAVGVLLLQSGNNTVAHNHIHDLYYTGISVGWTWGYHESGTENNLLEYNHIHNLGHAWLSDLGGIYTLAISPGSVIRYIHDVRSADYGGCGLYHDEGSSNYLSEGNVVYDCGSYAFCQHFGRENTARGNVFALAGEAQVQCGRAEPHVSFTLEGNLIYQTQGLLLAGNAASTRCRYRGNLYWNAAGEAPRFGEWTWDQWRAQGQDVEGVVADPGFRDPQQGDFTLAEDSPARALGFRMPDLSTLGPRGPVGAGMPPRGLCRVTPGSGPAP